jgi:SAM-dependent methyltransferase
MMSINDFINRWKKSNAAERSNFQLFMSELCDELGVPRPNPATENEAENKYVFERVVRFQHDDGSQTAGRIDLYRAGSFVLEGKQSRKRENDPRNRELVQLGLELGEASFKRTGTGKREGRSWDAVMTAAKQQAESYAKALPTNDGWPPFIIVVDVGHVIELYADFTLQGKHYAQFPDRQGYRISMDDLVRPEIQERLKAVWLSPLSLDPSLRTAIVTREIAELLALLSKSLEKRGYDAGTVATFLMRCLFTMFAEDVGLLRKDAFKDLLEQHQGRAEELHLALPHLWKAMNDGGYSPTLGHTILRFNGGLFKDGTSIPLGEQDLNWLILAAKREWKDVEPAIFGTLLERALNDRERHKLGAHYTPRAYVERLIVPTIIEPLTEDWRSIQTEAADLLNREERERALTVVRAFHAKLCNTRVLDPACGTGNFLYVALELMKRLEGEVLELLADLGDDQYLLEIGGHTVDPHQFLGLEINPRAVAIAELVLWIGYLQWHFRTRGKVMPEQPVLRAFANIRQQDAVLKSDRQEVLRDKDGNPMSRWDGITKKLHPITGMEIPDPTAKIDLVNYVNSAPADWPDAEFVVGNPPFIGNKRMIATLGEGYAKALRAAYPRVAETADFVMYWWAKAADLARANALRRFGFVTTNSITMPFNRAVIERSFRESPPLSLCYAIPDHPWSLDEDAAAVRIAMTVGQHGRQLGVLQTCHPVPGSKTYEEELGNPVIGYIDAMLRVGPSLLSAVPLRSNSELSYMGIIPVGLGFCLEPSEMAALGISEKRLPPVIKPYLSGRDLAQKSRSMFIIDFFGLSFETIQERYPVLLQRVLETVKPLRDTANRKNHRENWWIFGEARPGMRAALKGLTRYIGTPETSKHRWFVFMDEVVLPDQKIRVVASDDAFVLGVLSSRIHLCWALATGGTLEDRPVYNTTLCFDPFPFPKPPKHLRAKISNLAERLDTFRKGRLGANKALTMTGLYNVVEKLKAGKAVGEKDAAIYEAGLVSVLRQIHEELDAAVFEAYGWDQNLGDEQILGALVALNQSQALEERRGEVHWLRIDYQAPKDSVPMPLQLQAEFAVADISAVKPVFPKTPADQVGAVRLLLIAEGKPIRAAELARKFKQGKRVENRVFELLQIMAAIGQAQTDNGSRYFARR